MKDLWRRRVRKSGVHLRVISIVLLLIGTGLVTQAVGQAPAVAAGPTLVQTASSPALGTSSLAFGSSLTTGNTIVVVFTYDAGSYPRPQLRCTDTKSSIYTFVRQYGFKTGNNRAVGMCYTQNVVAGADTVSVNMTSYTSQAMTILEYSGLATLNVLDSSAAQTVTGATATDSITTGSTTTGVAGDLIVGGFECSTTPTSISAGTGYTSRSYASSVFVEDKVQAVAGPVTATATPSSASDCSGIVAGFKPSGPTRPNVNPGDGIVAYGSSGSNYPRSKNFLAGSSAMGEQLKSATSLAQGTYFATRTSPKKLEAIAGFVNSAGVLNVMCYDGSTWVSDWSVTVGGTGTTRRFDIAYESSSGDAMVLYSTDTATTNELAYRTKSGSTGCGTTWGGSSTNLDPVRTTGKVQWVKLAWDRRSTSDLMTAAWSDDASKLSAMQWSGSAWSNEPTTALETSLESASVTGDVQSFDLDYESISGDVMVTWGNSGGTDGTNGVRYRTCTGGITACTWSSTTTPPTFADDATQIDLAANPVSDEMVFASVGNAGNDLQAGYWDGSGWTDTANLDTSTQTVAAGNQMVAVGWLNSGTTSRSIVAFSDASSTQVKYYTGNVGNFGTPDSPSSFLNTPAFYTTQTWLQIETDPKNLDRLNLLVSDNAPRLATERLMMSSTGALTWNTADGEAGVEPNMTGPTAYSFAFFRNTTTYTQSTYQWYDAANSTTPGSSKAAENTQYRQTDATTAARLRVNAKLGDMGLAAGDQSFGLQYSTATTGPWANVTSSSPWCANATAPLCNSSWLSRRKITFDNSRSTTDLNSFPVLVVLNSTNIDYSKTQNAGEDLRFNDGDGTSLPYEIEKWNESGNSYVWVKVPKVDAGSKTDFIWMYYDNAAAVSGTTTANTNAVWTGNNYEAVYHMNQSPAGGTAGAIKDSTSNARNLTSVGAMVAGNLGTSQIGDGITFDGSNDGLNSSYTSSLTSAWTLEAWAKGSTTPNGSDQALIGKDTNYGEYWSDSTCFGVGPSYNNTAGNWQCAKSTASATNTYYDVGGTWSPANGLRTYLNGSLNASNTTAAAKIATNTNTVPMTIANENGSGFFGGTVDEVRISNIERSADWLLASYLSQTNQYETFGSVEAAAPVWKLFDNASATDGASVGSVSLSTSTLPGAYLENNGFTTNPTAIGLGDYGEWDYSLSPGSAMTDTTYYFRMVKGDGTAFGAYNNYGKANVAPSLNQEAFRIFNNAASADVGAPLANQDTATNTPTPGTGFRLRTLVHGSGKTWTAGAAGVKLQAAQRVGTCDIAGTGETYADVTAGAGAIRLYDGTPADGAAATSNANDPVTGHTKVMQSYEESGTAPVLTALPSGQDAEWDFSLVDNSAASGSNYCFRLVQADGTLFDTYTSMPEILTYTAAPTSWASDSLSTSHSGTRYDYSLQTTQPATLSKIAATVPSGSSCAARYLAGSGIDLNGASVPDSGTNSVTGDIDIRAQVSLDTWNPTAIQTLVAKYDTTTSQRSYMLRIEAGGALAFFWSTDGSNNFSATSSPLGFADGATKWVRATYQVNNGSGKRVTNLMTSDDNITWTTVQSSSSAATTGPSYDSTSDVTVGYRAGTTNAAVAGKIYYASVLSGIDGTPVSVFDPTSSAAGTSPLSWASSVSGETWSIIRTSTFLPADLECALTINANSAIGSGTAVLRINDAKIFYRVTSPASVGTFSNISFGVTGVTNTPTAGTYTSTIKTYSGTSTLVDTSTSNSLTFIVTNAAPNTPTSLLQKTNSGVTIATGGWHNAQIIKFVATATDSDSTDTLYLCVEKKPIGTSFGTTEDSCGSGVSSTASTPVSLTYAMSSIGDNTEYHWRARVKDASGAYSGWASYDTNLETDRDFGIDTSAPTGGTVFDGTSAGVDASYNTGSLTSLSANWSGVNSNVSGLAKYEYAVGTSAGGTDKLGWTDNGTATAVTATGLSLRTNVTYYVSVRTTDKAGNVVATPISSNGQQVAPSLTFTVTPAQVNMRTALRPPLFLVARLFSSLITFHFHVNKSSLSAESRASGMRNHSFGVYRNIAGS